MLHSLLEGTDWESLSYPYLCGLLGERPSRLSQAMHNAAFQEAGLRFFYVAFRTVDTEAGLKCMREFAWRGLSLTIPHKERAISLVDFLSEEAKAIGAINTVINTGSALFGFNTDCYGVEQAINEAGCEIASKRVIVYGAGGAARAAVYALKKMSCSEILIVNRNQARAEQLANDLGVDSLETSALSTQLLDSALLINATPQADEQYPFSLAELPKSLAVFDMVTRETPLLKAARERGCVTIAGIRMLLHQAVQQFQLFTAAQPNIETMQSALNKEIGGESDL